MWKAFGYAGRSALLSLRTLLLELGQDQVTSCRRWRLSNCALTLSVQTDIRGAVQSEATLLLEFN